MKSVMYMEKKKKWICIQFVNVCRQRKDIFSANEKTYNQNKIFIIILNEGNGDVTGGMRLEFLFMMSYGIIVYM